VSSVRRSAIDEAAEKHAGVKYEGEGPLGSKYSADSLTSLELRAVRTRSFKAGFAHAIEELRERAKSLDVLGASVLARDVAREADYLAARLEGELEKPKMRMKCGHCGGDHTWIDCPEAS
jgi:hypothetical protein